MSLSRPARFPLLKLPWLCIESVVRSWNIFDIIFFAAISQKVRRIVKSFRIPLNRIQIFLSSCMQINLGNQKKSWVFDIEIETRPWFEKQYQHSKKYPLVLKKNAVPLYTSRTKDALKSYIHGNTMNALKIAMEFLNEVFNCSVEDVDINGDNFPVSGDIGVKSTVTLCISQNSSQSFGYAQSQKLNLLLENLEVTGTCKFLMTSTEKGFCSLHLNYIREDFYCDPKLFKCRKIEFWPHSAAWVTREILLQFEVAQLSFYHCQFSVEDILSFVTKWARSDNKKLENLLMCIQSTRISLENFQTEEHRWVAEW